VPALADLELPTADAEIWRYSRIDKLDPGRFVPSPFVTDIAGPIDHVTRSGQGVSDIPEPDVFAAYNTAHQTALVIDVPRGVVIDEPIVITHRVPAGCAAFPRTIIRTGENSACTIVERFVSDPTAGDDGSLVVPVLSLSSAPGANVSYLGVNDLDGQSWQIGHQLVSGDRDSTTALSTVTLGGHYTRVRTQASAIASGATMRQVALYFAAGDQMHDFRVIQEHLAPHTTSDMLFKGAVQDRARSVYTGLISIAENARGTSSNQTNRNLTLSEGAWAESVPNLDIRNNDVKCSHASTVGPIDVDQRFYLESRGLPPEVAERLVVLGFFDEVIAQVPVAALADELRGRVAERLDLTGGAR
jgi:Fe-S cluster assembly protein SufD